MNQQQPKGGQPLNVKKRIFEADYAPQLKSTKDLKSGRAMIKKLKNDERMELLPGRRDGSKIAQSSRIITSPLAARNGQQTITNYKLVDQSRQQRTSMDQSMGSEINFEPGSLIHLVQPGRQNGVLPLSDLSGSPPEADTLFQENTTNFKSLLKPHLTEYQAVNLEDIKRFSEQKFNNKYRTAHYPVENANDLISQTLHSAETLTNKKINWDARLDEIYWIQSCLVNTKVLQMPQVNKFLNMITIPLQQQLFDLRSSIIKESCKCIQLMSEILQSEFEIHALNYLSELYLFKVMESSNNVLAQQAHKCVLSIVYNTMSPKQVKSMIMNVICLILYLIIEFYDWSSFRNRISISIQELAVLNTLLQRFCIMIEQS